MSLARNKNKEIYIFFLGNEMRETVWFCLYLLRFEIWFDQMARSFQETVKWNGGGWTGLSNSYIQPTSKWFEKMMKTSNNLIT